MARIERARIDDGVPHLRLVDQNVSALQIPLPPFAEVQRIITEVDRRLSLIRETEAQVNANLKRADRLRQSILRKAFRGELGVQENPEAPADVLHVPGVSPDLPCCEWRRDGRTSREFSETAAADRTT